ncbi:MAG: oxidoreductase [Deltaproteobacteria bacterium]|nr:oxidoreductase [Deltaproteobacteria bacterium]
MPTKPKIAIHWLGACGGCDETIVDLNEVLLNVADAVEIVLWPIALDFKYHDVERLADGEIALSIVHGNVRNSEHLEVARLLRRKSQLLLAFGACSCFGGTPALANLRSRDDLFRWVYHDAPTVVNPEGREPTTRSEVNGYELTLPEIFDRVYALDQVIPVDYYLPGCPPPPDLVGNAVYAALQGKLPPRGSTLAPHRALCDTCTRNATKPLKLSLTDVKGPHEVEVESGTCFLAKGVICVGPATRAGCGATCLETNTPCRGCFGPLDGVEDAGAKFLSALTSLCMVEAVARSIDDPVGYLYRFTQPSSILGKTKA